MMVEDFRSILFFTHASDKFYDSQKQKEERELRHSDDWIDHNTLRHIGSVGDMYFFPFLAWCTYDKFKVFYHSKLMRRVGSNWKCNLLRRSNEQ